jgi:hypothetical protein
MPWQQAAVDVAFEYDPVTGDLRYDEVDITVPRQSGKTTLTLAKKVHRLTVMAKKLGPQRSTYTAQTRLAARKKLERDFAAALSASRSFREVPHARARPTKATEWRLTLNNGSEAIQFGTGSYLQIDAPSRTGGHGDTLDDGTIDEAFSQEDDTVEGSMRPAMATRKNAQLWVISTAGDERSVYLWRKILAGRAATESGEHGRVCYIEYSAPDDADPGAPATWWGCMPALGFTVTEQFVQGEWERAQRKGPEGIDTFRRAYLNQWPNIPSIRDDKTGGIFAPGVWGALHVPGSALQDPVTFSVEIPLDRSKAFIGSVGPSSVEGRVQVELANVAAGTEWVVPWLTLNQARTVVVDGGNEAASLIPALEQAGLTVLKVNGASRAQACGGFYDAVVQGRVAHLDEPLINDALASAVWKEAEGTRTFSRRRSAGDISALYAVTLALHGHASTGPSAYEERELTWL